MTRGFIKTLSKLFKVTGGIIPAEVTLGSCAFVCEKIWIRVRWGRVRLKRRNRNPHGCDVLLIAKKHMADCDPLRVICLASAESCAALRSCVRQPTGNVPRRPIGAKAYQNIMSKVPQCSKQGCITKEAEAYLMSWVEGTQPLIPRPRKYKFLEADTLWTLMLLLRQLMLDGKPLHDFGCTHCFLQTWKSLRMILMMGQWMQIASTF